MKTNAQHPQSEQDPSRNAQDSIQRRESSPNPALAGSHANFLPSGFKEAAAKSPQVQQAMQLQAMANKFVQNNSLPIQRQENSTGLPDTLKSGIENLSGYSMDDVRVHYNSPKPAQLQAHAYAQGSEIHIARGQERHLPHEAWHVVQQKQGRVRPTRQLKGKVPVNDDRGLEREADLMGAKALQMKPEGGQTAQRMGTSPNGPVQRVVNDLQEPKLTQAMKIRWAKIYPMMQTILSATTFGASAKHSIVLWAASNASLASIKNAYASTSLYMSKTDAKSGYSVGDYGEFDFVNLPYNFSTTPNRAYRIVIAFNLTLNKSEEELLATFLHELHLHAMPFMADVSAGRDIADSNSDREDAEHKGYANMDDKNLGAMVTPLGLAQGQATKVFGKLKADAARYDKGTGKIK